MRFALLLAGLALAVPASAANLIVNGDFETGSLAGWTLNTAATSSGVGAVIANGGAAPVSANSTSAARVSA